MIAGLRAGDRENADDNNHRCQGASTVASRGMRPGHAAVLGGPFVLGAGCLLWASWIAARGGDPGFASKRRFHLPFLKLGSRRMAEGLLGLPVGVESPSLQVTVWKPGPGHILVWGGRLVIGGAPLLMGDNKTFPSLGFMWQEAGEKV